jgi:membrane-bound lytic murein transglycosylase D
MRDPVRAIRKLGPNIVDIIEKYEAHRWGNAARNFYPCFLAARELARNYQDYFPGIQLDPPLTYAEAPLPVSASPGNISRSLGVPIEELRRLNPSVTDAVWDATEDSPRFVPAGFTLKLPVSSEKNWTELALRIPEENIRYTVRPGDNLPRIAKKFGVAQATLKRLNNLTAKNSVVYIYPNQILTIPVRGELMNPGKEPREASGETL